MPDHLVALASYVERALDALRARVIRNGRLDVEAFDAEQHAAHGVAWLTVYAAALDALAAWHAALPAPTPVETLTLTVATGEYLAQVVGGLPMSQTETARPLDLGLAAAAQALAANPAVAWAIEAGCAASTRERLAAALAEADYGRPGAPDETLDLIRAQFRRFADTEVMPHAQAWHRTDSLIPLPLLQSLGGMGCFGLSVGEAFGGAGLGKIAMAVVSEELSRGYIGVGSLGTRADIAAELIEGSGTPEQRTRFLPGIASGDIIPAAAFTEPDTGSDLGALATRAIRDGDTYRITGSKTWITHAARADLLTLLARTGRPEEGYRGLSMFLLEKPRGTADEPFPLSGLSGSEIEVIGYRGMKEYVLAFDGVTVPAQNLLGGVEGHGFRQLMATFESARIQTAARAVGVAQNALELATRYAHERRQFGRPIAAFPRIAGKLAVMAAEVMAARQLTYAAARVKDRGQRSDIEAGMAKLLAARVAWAAADAAVQVHGGNGYAQEYPVSRVLCDARILSVFEGTAEIQAQVVARGLLTRRDERATAA